MSRLQLDHGAHRPTSEKYPLCFLADDVDGPMNIGGFFRIADALGVERIYLTGGSVTPPNEKIRRAARSTEKYVPYRYEPDALSVVQALKGWGYRIVSLEITQDSIPLEDFSVETDDRICLVLGSENRGIHDRLLAASDVTVHVPMQGVNSSMNVAAACAIATYEITRKFARVRAPIR